MRIRDFHSTVGASSVAFGVQLSGEHETFIPSISVKEMDSIKFHFQMMSD